MIKNLSFLKASKEQNEMISKIKEIENFILLEQESIANENTQKGVIKKQRQKHKEKKFSQNKRVL